jgi:hypothetical protein
LVPASIFSGGVQPSEKSKRTSSLSARAADRADADVVGLDVAVGDALLLEIVRNELTRLRC